MPPQEIFEVTSFEIVSGAILGRLFEDVILCIHFTLAGGSCPVDVQSHASYTPPATMLCTCYGKPTYVYLLHM